jgi:two-component system cell cycle response regulator CtrA
MRTLLVQNDSFEKNSVAVMLCEPGLQIERAPSSEDAASLAQYSDFDVILLHLRSPSESLAALRRLRGAGIEIPILVLSGLTPLEVKISAFNAGADDFIVQPCEKAELLARMRAAVRRSRGFSSTTLQVGPLSLNLHTREATVSGQPVRLTHKQYEVLELLTLRKGTSVAKQTLMDHLYGGLDEPEPKIIDVFVSKLRKVLREAGAPDLIGTVWGRGYIIRHGAKATPNAVGAQEIGAVCEAG